MRRSVLVLVLFALPTAAAVGPLLAPVLAEVPGAHAPEPPSLAGGPSASEEAGAYDGPAFVEARTHGGDDGFGGERDTSLRARVLSADAAAAAVGIDETHGRAWERRVVTEGPTSADAVVAEGDTRTAGAEGAGHSAAAEVERDRTAFPSVSTERAEGRARVDDRRTGARSEARETAFAEDGVEQYGLSHQGLVWADDDARTTTAWVDHARMSRDGEVTFFVADAGAAVEGTGARVVGFRAKEVAGDDRTDKIGAVAIAGGAGESESVEATITDLALSREDDAGRSYEEGRLVAATTSGVTGEQGAFAFVGSSEGEGRYVVPDATDHYAHRYDLVAMTGVWAVAPTGDGAGASAAVIRGRASHAFDFDGWWMNTTNEGWTVVVDAAGTPIWIEASEWTMTAEGPAGRTAMSGRQGTVRVADHVASAGTRQEGSADAAGERQDHEEETYARAAGTGFRAGEGRTEYRDPYDGTWWSSRSRSVEVGAVAVEDESVTTEDGTRRAVRLRDGDAVLAERDGFEFLP